MTPTDAFGLAGCGLLCLALIASALRLEKRATGVRIAVAAGAALILCVPVGDLPAVAYVRGVTGDLSAATLALAAGALWRRLGGRALIAPRELSALLGLVAVAALFLYPFALGWTPFDPYALGYGSIALVTALFLAALAAWRYGLQPVAVVVTAAGLAYLLGLYESRNLWDYLLDPLAAIYALGALLVGGAGKLISQRRQGAPVV